MRQLRARWQRTPAHVVHLSDSIINWQLFILFAVNIIKLQILNVSVIQHFLARGICTRQLGYLALLYFYNNHVFDALFTKVVLTPWHEEKTGAKQVPCADSAIVLLFIKLSAVSQLGHIQVCLRLLSIFKLNFDNVFSICIFRMVSKPFLLEVCLHKFILKEYRNLIEHRHVLWPLVIDWIDHELLIIPVVLIELVGLQN